MRAVARMRRDRTMPVHVGGERGIGRVPGRVEVHRQVDHGAGSRCRGNAPASRSRCRAGFAGEAAVDVAARRAARAACRRKHRRHVDRRHHDDAALDRAPAPASARGARSRSGPSYSSPWTPPVRRIGRPRSHSSRRRSGSRPMPQPEVVPRERRPRNSRPAGPAMSKSIVAGDAAGDGRHRPCWPDLCALRQA